MLSRGVSLAAPTLGRIRLIGKLIATNTQCELMSVWCISALYQVLCACPLILQYIINVFDWQAILLKGYMLRDRLGTPAPEQGRTTFPLLPATLRLLMHCRWQWCKTFSCFYIVSVLLTNAEPSWTDDSTNVSSSNDSSSNDSSSNDISSNRQFIERQFIEFYQTMYGSFKCTRAMERFWNEF